MKPLTDTARTDLLKNLMGLQDKDSAVRYASIDALREAVEIMDDRNIRERTYAKARADATAWIDVVGSGYGAHDSDGKIMLDTVAPTKSVCIEKLTKLQRPGGIAEHITATAIVTHPVPRASIPAAPAEPAPRVRRMRAGNE